MNLRPRFTRSTTSARVTYIAGCAFGQSILVVIIGGIIIIIIIILLMIGIVIVIMVDMQSPMRLVVGSEGIGESRHWIAGIALASVAATIHIESREIE